MEIGAPLLWQIINFLVLFLLLSYSLYKPLNNLLEARGEEIEKREKRTKEEEEEAKVLKRKYQEELDRLDAHAETILKEMREEGQREKMKILKEAQKESRYIEERTGSYLEKMKIQMREDLRVEMGDLAIDIASHLLKRSVDDKVQNALVEEYLEALEEIELVES